MRKSFTSPSHHRRWKIVFCNPALNPIASLFHAVSRSKITSITGDHSSTDIDSHEKFLEGASPTARIPPEWTDFMEILLKRGYFEDSVTMSSLSSATNDTNSIRTACLNYARERAGLLQSLPKVEVKVIARHGCPSIDRKVVNSGKRLRAYAGITEANACGSCNLRGQCERAYADAREDEPGRTVDLMRILFSFLFASDGIVLSDNLMLKQSVIRVLKDIVHHDGKLPFIDRRTAPKSQPLKQGDWICLQCNYHNFAKNIRCLRCNELSREKVKELKNEIEHLPLKKGDWICETCNFFNFARNTKCFVCSERPVNRKVNPGEWECESCHYINFRRNVKCLNCDYNRAKRWSVETVNIGLSGKSQPKRSNTWTFVGVKSKSTMDEVDFPDFPVSGGITSLSENMEKKEKLRSKMTKPSLSEEELRKMKYERKMKYVQCSDGEELADWFGS